MGPCVSDFGCLVGSRASLTDAAVRLAMPAAHTASIHQSPSGISVNLANEWRARQTCRDARAQNEREGNAANRPS